MPYPKTQTDPKKQNPAQVLDGLQIKKQEDFPLFMCEFFEGFEVLQTQGIKSGEYLFGIYFRNQLCGHIYFGDRWTQPQAAQICKDIMPPTWQQIEEYVILKCEKAHYWKMDQSQYAWIYERVIKKIS